jgi:transitional endoplasmic reticulum ATPase
MAKLSEIIFICTDMNKSNEIRLHNPPISMLLIGEHMLDKLDMIKIISDKAKTKLYYIDCSEILTFKRYGEPEEYIRNVFRNAKASTITNGSTIASIIYLDRLEILTSNKGSFDSSLMDRVINQFVICIDKINFEQRSLIIASVSNIKHINELLPRVRFDLEISVDPLEKEERLSILRHFTLNTMMNNDIDLNVLAVMTEGYGRAEIRQLVRSASTHALKRYIDVKYSDYVELPNCLDSRSISSNFETNKAFEICMEDFVSSLKNQYEVDRPTQTIPNLPTLWEDLGGYSKTIQEIRETLEWPMKYPELFKVTRISMPKGILLYGPPGNGKTKIAKAIHHNFPQATFINVKGPELISKWIGESEMAIRETFQQARENTPAIIFIDEIDSIAPSRSSDIDKSEVMNRMVSQMLIEMDGLESLEGVIVIGATNRIEAIDKALLRPGRFDKLFYIAPPNKEDRLEILKVLTKQIKLSKDVDLRLLAKMTEKYNGADLYGLITEAKKESLREYILSCDNNTSIEKASTLCINNSHIITAKKKIDSRGVTKESHYTDVYR